ncbi:hypothetical protein ASE05_31795 [Mesorhizobium sp. Root172]|nr:hypothetical protein ASE05_31795 [Mesorhizobium sp. Root172]
MALSPVDLAQVAPLIAERTKAGMKAAMARGKLLGNPGLRERRPEATRAVSVARDRLYLDELITSAQLWLPTVRRMPAASASARKGGKHHRLEPGPPGKRYRNSSRSSGCSWRSVMS